MMIFSQKIFLILNDLSNNRPFQGGQKIFKQNSSPQDFNQQRSHLNQKVKYNLGLLEKTSMATFKKPNFQTTNLNYTGKTPRNKFQINF